MKFCLRNLHLNIKVVVGFSMVEGAFCRVTGNLMPGSRHRVPIGRCQMTL